MFRHYLMTGLRNIAQHKLYSFINIAGLAVGLAGVIFVILFVRDELSWDKWIPGTENLYRVELTVNVPDRPSMTIGVMPFPLPAAMRDASPKITDMTRLYVEYMTLTTGDRQFREKVNGVDPGFFKLVQLPLVAGDRETVLRQPDSIVLSQAAARKYFGDANPIGKILLTGPGPCSAGSETCSTQPVSLRVTGVMKDLPYNSQLNGDGFIPNTSRADRTPPDAKSGWFQQNGWGYVRLAPGADPADVAAGMAPMLDRDATPALHDFGIMRTGSQVYTIHLTPFARMHLAALSLPSGSAITLYGVIAVGVLVLMLACFNFMNLATARAMLRAREIGLRKVMGGKRMQLMAQFLGEAVLMALLALGLALTLVEVLLPSFTVFLQRPITFGYLADWPLLLLALGIAVGAGLVGGFYPALVLSGFRPVATLRGGPAKTAGSGGMRNLLVVLQFAVSIGLGIIALVVFSQINYARTFDLGFRHQNILVLGSGSLTAEQREAFAQTLRTNPGILEVGQSDYLPFDFGQSLAPVQVPGQPDSMNLNLITADPHYPAVYGIKLVAGRLLSPSRELDVVDTGIRADDPRAGGHSILVNVAGARRLGFTPQEAVGKDVAVYQRNLKIVGVLADTMAVGALRVAAPTVYEYIPPRAGQAFSIRVRPERLPETLAFVDRTWHAFSPNAAIQRKFLDDDFAKLYQDQERQGTIFGIFVGVAIVIACMGLFGLAAFAAGRRTREIGIRKVFGARVREVLALLLWQFSLPVLLANAMAWPIAWYYLHGWLQSFAYRITLSPVYFLGAGLCALGIALATVFVHALHVARANPIKALRYE